MFELETARLRLIPLDGESLRLSLENPRLLERHLGLQPGNYTLEGDLRDAVQQMLAGVLKDPKNWLWYTHWQIIVKALGPIIGGICFKGPAKQDGQVEIGYGIDDEHQGYGYMTEALQVLLAWAQAQPGVLAVIAETEKENAASHRILEKLGFVRDRETEEAFWWSSSPASPGDSHDSTALYFP